MNVRFTGVIHYTGLTNKIDAELENVMKNEALAVTASDYGEGVALYGTDSEKFLKDQYNIEIPQELKNKSQAEALEIFKANPDKYKPFLNKIEQVILEAFTFINNVFNYYKTAKNNGNKDIDGNPVEEKQLG